MAEISVKGYIDHNTGQNVSFVRRSVIISANLTPKTMEKEAHITGRKNLLEVIPENEDPKESLVAWLNMYFEVEVTTSESSRKIQSRDLKLFAEYFQRETGHDQINFWTPRLSQDFLTHLKTHLNEAGGRRWNDRTVNRILAHLKTFAKWVYKHKLLPLGNPTAKLKNVPTASLLSVERAFNAAERRRLLDAADLLLKEGGRSKDRKRYGKLEERPRHKSYRALRNRAIIYCLVETGMRRAAATTINLDEVDFEGRKLPTIEKGNTQKTYQISREGIEAIKDYAESEERKRDAEEWQSPALFLVASSVPQGNGRLAPKAVNAVWNEAAEKAGLSGKTPHCARHAMGLRILKKTGGNIAAVQLQLGHKNVGYSIQYTRISEEELKRVLDDE